MSNMFREEKQYCPANPFLLFSIFFMLQCHSHLFRPCFNLKKHFYDLGTIPNVFIKPAVLFLSRVNFFDHRQFNSCGAGHFFAMGSLQFLLLSVKNVTSGEIRVRPCLLQRNQSWLSPELTALVMLIK